MSKSREYVIARYEVRGHKFEILVDPDRALEYREGRKVDLDEVLKGDYIYKDARRGDKASPEELVRVFGTEDVKTIADVVIKKGELQLTTEQRRRMLESKRKQVVNYIARSAVDPKTKTPIPPQRIEKAMEEARVSIDLYRGVEEQAAAVVKAISRILPIRIARAKFSVKVPPDIAARVAQDLKRLGEVKSEDWGKDGSFKLEFEVPAGLQYEVIDKINKVTKGQAEVKIEVF
ncbi:MAG: ribosome assembly factor SBDS [Sulfolobales archaeon]|nr:ribosome assembly factor SBDS [Sulfolobales archaeon]MCX8208948.1 ribosome assembly factor SBDS [Sulfolobales archaeon]MDW8010398.1 ribosome assembly factor SBDS [Sulfolobales archaeon]